MRLNIPPEAVLVGSKDIPPIRIDYYSLPDGTCFKTVVIPKGHWDQERDHYLTHRSPCNPYKIPVVDFQKS